MAIELYLSPIVQVATPHGTSANAPAVFRHRTNNERVSAIMPNPQRDWTIAAVHDPSPETLAAIAADDTITKLPFNSDTLDEPFGSLSPGAQNAILNALSARRIPTAWIQPDTPIRLVVRFVLRILDLVTRLRADFPDVELTQTYGSLPAAQRTRIRNALTQIGIDPATLGVTAETTIGEALVRIANARNAPVTIGALRL